MIKTMSLEELMVKAIRTFRKNHKNAEVRSIYAAESTGSEHSYSDVTFHIEYVEEVGGEYKAVYINVNAEGNTNEEEIENF